MHIQWQGALLEGGQCITSFIFSASFLTSFYQNSGWILEYFSQYSIKLAWRVVARKFPKLADFIELRKMHKHSPRSNFLEFLNLIERLQPNKVNNVLMLIIASRGINTSKLVYESVGFDIRLIIHCSKRTVPAHICVGYDIRFICFLPSRSGNLMTAVQGARYFCIFLVSWKCGLQPWRRVEAVRYSSVHWIIICRKIHLLGIIFWMPKVIDGCNSLGSRAVSPSQCTLHSKFKRFFSNTFFTVLKISRCVAA